MKVKYSMLARASAVDSHEQNRSSRRRRGVAGSLACGCLALCALDRHARAADDALSPVIVTATRVAERSFDLPVAVDRVGAARIHDGQLQVNLSESLDEVPGASV